MREVPGPDSDRHVLLLLDFDDDVGERAQLAAHGQTWVMPADQLEADTTCPGCGVLLLA